MSQAVVSRTRSGGLKLSEVARHVVLPEGIVTSGFPPVEAKAREMGVRFDKWQQGLGSAMLAKREDGLYAAGIGGVVVSIPRQVGKTFTMGSIVFALCILNPNLTVLWSAHRSKTHNETFRSMSSMAQRRAIAPYISAVRASHGEETVSFNNGSRILFGAREQGFGRGFAMVDILVLDEAQILTENAMTDMVPATNAAPNGLVLMMGTPPRENDPGEVFMNRRREALSGDDVDTLYVELSADRHADIDDREQWRKANPSFPHRTSETAILRMRKLLGSREAFMREGLGIWDEEALTKKALDFKAWESRQASDVPSDGRRVFAARFAVDGSAVALAAAIRPDDGPVHVEGIRLASMADGTQWLLDWLLDHQGNAAQIIVEGKSGVGYLVNALREEKVGAKVIITPTTEQVVAAHSMFENAVNQGGMTHRGQDELDAQVKQAEKRKIGTTGGFGWQAPEGESVALLDAVTLAYWGAKTTKRRPGRKATIL